MSNIAKMLAAVGLILVAVTLGDDHAGLVPLRAVVRSSTSISVVPTPLAANLDIDGNAASGPIATVVERSNVPYKVYLTSDNLVDERLTFDSLADLGHFYLRQSGTSISRGGGLGERINYTLTYDGVAVPLHDYAYDPASGMAITEGSFPGRFPVNPTGGAGITKSLNIVIQPNQNFSAGIYSDTLTLIISPDTTVL